MYDVKKLEMQSLDKDRASESLDIYTFPMDQYSDTLNVTVNNNCELAINIVRIWINDTYTEVSTSLQPMSKTSLNPIHIIKRTNSTYNIMVTTDRGNVFASETGTLCYGKSGWETELFAINVLISSPGVHFTVTIDKDGQHIPPTPEDVQKLNSGSVSRSYIIESPGTYHVTITKQGGTGIIYDGNVTVMWPSGSPIVWIYA